MVQILACSYLASHEDVVRKHNDESAKIMENHYQPTSVIEKSPERSVFQFFVASAGIVSGLAAAD
jgi:hypothetical protein